MLRLDQRWKLLLPLVACFVCSSGAPLTCDLTSAQQCTDHFIQDLSDATQTINDTREYAFHLCNFTYPGYLECIDDCNQTIPNIWVSAVEFLCQKTEAEQEIGLTCLARPEVADGVLACNANIPQKTDDACGLVTNHTQCVNEVTSQFCSPVGSSLIREYMLHLLEGFIADFSCFNFTTPLPFTTVSPVPEPGSVCGTECLKYISQPSLAYNEALVRENFTLVMFLDSCSDLDLYFQCMLKYPDCDADNEAVHSALLDPLAFACGPGKQGIVSQNSCWEKEEVKRMWSQCIFGMMAQDNDVCVTWSGRRDCLNSKIQDYCSAEGVAVVHGFTNAVFPRVLKTLNCTVQVTPEPEMTDAPTTSEPQPEPEMTDAPATPEPGPEMTDAPATPESGPETTDAQATSNPEMNSTTLEPETTPRPATQCDVAAYLHCSANFNKKIQTWTRTVTTNAILTNSFNVSFLDSLCSAFSFEYLPCVLPAISGCTRDLTLMHETLSSALNYVCTADRSGLSYLLECLGKPTVLQGVQRCSANIPKTTRAICNLPKDYADCLNDVTSGVCFDTANAALDNLLSQILKPYNDFFACDQSSTTTTTTPTPSTTTTAASTTTFKTITDAVTGLPGVCGVQCRGELDRVFSQPNVSLLTYVEACPLYSSFKQCYDSKPENCHTPGPDDTINKIFNYTCGDGYDGILNNSECWKKPEIGQSLLSCSRELNPGMDGRMCTAFENYNRCIETKVLSICGQEASDVLMDFVRVTTKDARQHSNCPDPIPVSPTRNIACYDCHSGGGSWRNPHCTVDGNITDSYVAVTTCKDSCIAKTNKWNQGVIVRGCGDTHLPLEFPRPLPRSGCHEISDETWCFCDSDKCNTMSMNAYLP